jgi:hypothetical protein
MSNAKSLVKAFTATVGLILVVGAITASAQTSQFVSMMRNARVFFADGTAAAPTMTFASNPTTGFYWISSGKIGVAANGAVPAMFSPSALSFGADSTINWTSSNGNPNGTVDTVLCRGAANVIGIGGCTSSFPAIKRNTTQIEFKLGDDSAFTTVKSGFFTVNSGYLIGGNMLIAVAAPTISSGFGTSPSIVSSNGPAAFLVNVGTGGVATSGVVGLPAAVTGWSCFANDRTNNTVTRQTATTTTSATFTAAAAWAASDILNISCFGY